MDKFRIDQTETAARNTRRTPYLAQLYRRGTITLEIAQAGFAVRRLIATLSGDPSMRVSRLSGIHAGTGHHLTGEAQHHQLSRRMWAVRVFGCWKKKLMRRGIPLDPIIDVVEHERSLTQTDRHYRLRNGTARTLVIEGLGIFSKMACDGSCCCHVQPN